MQYPLTTNHKTHIAPKNQPNVLHPAEENRNFAENFNRRAHKDLAKKQPGENPFFSAQTRRFIQLWEEAAIGSQADAKKDAYATRPGEKKMWPMLLFAAYRRCPALRKESAGC